MADEAVAFQRAGVPAMRALQIVTVGSATCLGIEGRTGTIAPGLEADLVVLGADPLARLEALKDIVLVVGNGTIAFQRRRWHQPPGPTDGERR